MLNIGFWTHLFDSTGFPVSRITFGHGWDKPLLFFSVAGESFSALAYLLLMLGFTAFLVAWKCGRIDRLAAEKHVPRIVFAYILTAIFCFALHLINIYCYWVPLYRLAGLSLLLSGIALFAASIKTLWAFASCYIWKGTA